MSTRLVIRALLFFSTVSSLQSLAILYIHLKRYDDAERRMEETLSIQRRILGDDHPDTLVLAHNLGEIYRLEGRNEEAEKQLLSVYEKRLAKLGEDHPYVFVLRTVFLRARAGRPARGPVGGYRFRSDCQLRIT